MSNNKRCWSAAARASLSLVRVGNTNSRKYDCEDRRVVRCFCWMQDRCKRAKRVCAFTRTQAGFNEFVEEMGAIPKGMKRPSVGRIDHDKGYVKGNLKWEEHSYNSWKSRRTEEEVNGLWNEEIPF